MISRKVSRRCVLSGLGAGSVLLPFVPLTQAQVEQSGAPKRLIFLYSSNGTVHESWAPKMVGGQLSLSPILAPLERHKDRLLVVDGLDYTVVLEKGQKDGHFGGMNTALTGRSAKIIDPNDPDGNSLATGISVDQHIAQAIAPNAKFRSLQSGIQVDDFAATVAALSYAGSMQPLMPENDPYAVFDRVFKGFDPTGTMPDPGLEQDRQDRQSVIDLVRADLNTLGSKLGTDDQKKVEAHLEAIRQVERTLGSGLSTSAIDSCAIPDVGSKLDINQNDNIPALGRLQIDLMLMAMACDLTRVGTIQYGRAGAQHRFTWLGDEFKTDPDNGPNDSTSGIHGLAHDEANPASRAKLVKCHSWYAGELSYLLDRLKAIPEGSGTMADNTLVVWLNEMGTGNHSLNKTPWVIAGNLQGHFKTGQVLSFPGESHNRLLLSLVHAFGLEDGSFGDTDYGSSPLGGLS